MPVSLLPFLFVLLQFLHFSGENIGCETGNSTAQFSVPARHTWNKISPDRVLNLIAEEDNPEESHNHAFGTIAFCNPVSEAYQPAPFIRQTARRIQVYQARASIGEPRLFLIHCNFRV